MNRLSSPFDMTSVKTDNGSTDCNDLDGFDPGLLSGTGAGGGIDQAFVDINIVDNVQTLCKICHSYKGHKNNDFKRNKVTQ